MFLSHRSFRGLFVLFTLEKCRFFFVVKAELNANFVSEGVSSFFSLWQSVGFFRYGSQNLTPFLFLKKILLLFTLAKYWIFSLIGIFYAHLIGNLVFSL
ncbi:unnamed protein product [Rhizophagus irregularis]|nr:unnamed protein product [Rhizophagus irregularis]